MRLKTIGPAVSSSTGIKTVDAGAPTIGMHSIREITGSEDPFMIFQMINQFFSMESFSIEPIEIKGASN